MFESLVPNWQNCWRGLASVVGGSVSLRVGFEVSKDPISSSVLSVPQTGEKGCEFPAALPPGLYSATVDSNPLKP